MQKMAGINWVLDRNKFLSLKEAKRLLEKARDTAETAVFYGHKIAVRDYFVIHIALATGLRVSEIAQLNCGDVCTDGHFGYLIVQKGKGGKKRLAQFNSRFKEHYHFYIKWKQENAELIGPDDPLLMSSHTGRHMTVRAIEKVFKRVAAKAGLPEHYSIHCTRHTHACLLYKASGYNLRLVQKQLGHSRSQTTEVYADVMNPDITRSLEKLYV